MKAPDKESTPSSTATRDATQRRRLLLQGVQECSSPGNTKRLEYFMCTILGLETSGRCFADDRVLCPFRMAVEDDRGARSRETIRTSKKEQPRQNNVAIRRN